ncbi:hypothetical protein [Streptomyces yangpuensis]|uniref:hypothetical protein n=1 Tax=Streptomyces yangpuensis TaxID=1648182 RepID=UPI003720A8DA
MTAAGDAGGCPASRSWNGPWVGWTESRHGLGGARLIQLRADADADAEEDDEIHLTRATGGHAVGAVDARTDADIEFIAAARQDVPRPVKEIRRLRAVLEEARPADRRARRPDASAGHGEVVHVQV